MYKIFTRFQQRFSEKVSLENNLFRSLIAELWKNVVERGLKIFIVLLCLNVGGCQNGVFDKSGQCLFSTNSQTKAKTVGSNKEGELVRNTISSTGSNTNDTWKPTEAEAARKEVKIDTRDAAAYYTAQRPNGAVLFPNKLDRLGPCVVLEPRTLVAPVGEEIVLVASYVGEGNEYLKTGEKLRWTLDGVGKFQTNNPAGFLNGGCLDGSVIEKCKLTPGSQKEYGDLLETVTSTKLWRIHRGTATPLDDISILRGQSWISLQSAQEGTSAVTVLANNIDNWNNRTAFANIYWLDAYFLFPKSGTAPAGQAQQLTTSVVRKSNPSEPRSGWLVRYEVVSGPEAGFGPTFAKEIEVATNAEGQANVILTQKTPANGTNQVLVKIIKPAADVSDRIVAAEKQITQAWTGESFFSIKISGPASIKRNTPAPYKIQVTNLTAAPLSAVLVTPLGQNVKLVSSTPAAFLDRGTLVWNLDNIPARKAIEINLSLLLQEGGVIDLNPRIRRKDRGSALSGGSEIPGRIEPPSSSVAPNISGSAVNPATQPPILPSTPPGGSASTGPAAGQLVINVKKPPVANARVNEEFSFALELKNPNRVNLQNISIDTYLPEGIAYVTDGKRYYNSVINFGKQPASGIIDKTVPFVYVGTTPGEKIISVKFTDSATNVLLGEYKTKVTVSGQAVPGSQRPRQVTVDIIPQDTGAPNFNIGSVVKFIIKIKNNENYTLSGLKLFCIPEENRSLKPWNFVQSEPSGVTKNSASEAWTYNLPSIPSGGENGLTISFSPQKPISNGKFIVEVQSQNSETPLGAKVYRYTILQKLNRPVFTEEFPGKISVPANSEKKTDITDPQGTAKTLTPPAISDSSKILKLPSVAKPADTSKVPSSVSEKLDSQTLLKPDQTQNSEKNSAQKKTEKISDSDENSDSVLLKKVSVLPFVEKGKIVPFTNLGVKGKSFSSLKDKTQTAVGQEFIYKIVLKNEETVTLPADKIELAIEYDNKKLKFSDKQKKSPKFDIPTITNDSVIIRQSEEIKSGENLNLDLAFRAIKEGETYLNINLKICSNGKLCGIYRFPVIVKPDK